MKSYLIFSFKNILKRRRQSLILISALILSLVLCCLIGTLGEATVKSFGRSVVSISGESDLIVTRDDGGFARENLDKILDMEIVKGAAAFIKERVFFTNSKQQKSLLTIIGIDFLNDSEFFKGKRQKEFVEDPIDFMSNPNSIALSEGAAIRHGAKLGDEIDVLTPRGKKKLKVKSIFQDEDIENDFGESMAIMDLEAAMLVFDESGRVDQINVKLQPDVSLADAQALISQAIGSEFSVSPPSALVESLKDTVGPFKFVLYLMGSLAFLLTLYLISTLSKNTLDERVPEFGVLRAMGAERGYLLRLIYSEYVLIALFGVLVGCCGGWLLALGLLSKLNGIVSYQLGGAIDLKPDDLQPMIPLALGVTSFVMVLVSILPDVWRISFLPPSTIIRSKNSVPHLESRFFTRGVLWGLLAASLLSVVVLDRPLFLVLGLAVSIGVLPPIFLSERNSIRSLVPWLFKSRFRLGVDYALKDSKMSRSKVRGLFVSFVIIFVTSIVHFSFESALKDRFARSSRPDMFVTSNGDLTSPLQLQPMHEDFARELRLVDGVSGVYGQRIVKVSYQGKKITLRAFDEVPPENPKLKRPYSHFDIVDRPVEDAGRDLYHKYKFDQKKITVLASETLKHQLAKKFGDEFTLLSPRGPVTVEVVGIIRDLSAGAGALYMSRDAYRYWWTDQHISGFALTLSGARSEQDVKQDIENRFSGQYGVVVTLDTKLQKDSLRVVNKGFFYMNLLEILILAVGVLNFVSTFMIQISRREKELATLRSIGLSSSSTLGLVLTEVTFMTSAIVLFSFLVSWGVSYKLVTGGVTSALGWYIDFSLDYVRLSFVIVGIVFLIMLAGLIPALRASRVVISRALREE